MTTNLGKKMTYREGLPFITLHEPLSSGFARSRNKLKTFYLHYNTWSHQIVVGQGERLPPSKSQNHLIKWNVWSCDRLKTLNLDYQDVYGHQTCQGGAIQRIFWFWFSLWRFKGSERIWLVATGFLFSNKHPGQIKGQPKIFYFQIITQGA